MAEETQNAAEVTKKFKRKRVVTVPTLKFVVDKPLYVKITEKLHEGKQRTGRNGNVKLDSDGNPRKPPTLLGVIDLETGEPAQLIAATIIKTELAEGYPNDTYLGKCFEITKQKRKEGREYDPYQIIEIEDPVPEETVPDKKEDVASAAPSAGKKK